VTKRLILAVGLSIAVLFAFNLLFYRRVERQVIEQKEESPVLTRPQAPLLRPGIYPEMQTGEASKKEVIVETRFYKVVFSPHGAIKQWLLKEYKESRDSEEMVDLASGTDTGPCDFIYEVSSLSGEKGVSLSAKSLDVIVQKEIIFEEEKYFATLKFKIHNTSPVVKNVVLFQWGPGLDRTSDVRQIVFTSCCNERPVRYRAHKIKSSIQLKDVSWAGINSKYFAIVFFPQTKGQSLFIERKKEGPLLKCEIEEVPPGAVIPGELRIYALPKDYQKLKSEGYNLHQLVDFGTFGIIGKGIFYLLRLFYKLTKNYGVAIILISILIKIVLFPLSRKGIKSMQDMQRLQPQIEMLRQRFKHDQEAFTRETMELYKRMKINPMGGCLPILFQIPVFFALFVVLQNSIELRQAPFVLWIKDLSVADPYFVLPILMGITTFLQQKMAPSSSQTQGMNYFMSIFLTFIFLTFPAGLVLYWLVNNILSIGEQYLIKTMA